MAHWRDEKFGTANKHGLTYRSTDRPATGVVAKASMEASGGMYIVGGSLQVITGNSGTGASYLRVNYIQDDGMEDATGQVTASESITLTVSLGSSGQRKFGTVCIAPLKGTTIILQVSTSGTVVDPVGEDSWLRFDMFIHEV